jgi:hypothetical protein
MRWPRMRGVDWRHWRNIPRSKAILSACSTARRGEPLTGAMRLASPQQQHGQMVFMEIAINVILVVKQVAPAINNKPFPDFLKNSRCGMDLGQCHISVKKKSHPATCTI